MIAITVDATSLAQVQRTLNATNAQIDRAAVRAVNKTLGWTRTQGRRLLAKGNDLPVKVLRNRIHLGRASAGALRGVAWFGVAPIKAIYAGAARQARTGVTVRRHTFAGAFLARMPTGHLGIFKRRGPARLPIEEQRIYLANADAVAQTLAAQAPPRLQTLFGQELNYELNVKGY